jgi:hypothetical protein
MEEKMKTNPNIPTILKDKLTYCVHCKKTILWYRSGKLTLLRKGMNNVFECITHGCVLIVHTLPEEYCGPEEIGSFLLTLIKDGIPARIAETAALKLINVSLAA